MDVVQAIKSLRDAKLEIDTDDELYDMSNGEFEVDEHANFEVVSHAEFEVKANEDFKFVEEVQDSPYQEDKDFTLQDQDSPRQEDQDNPHHNDLASLDTIICQEVLIKIILQDISYND
jgi:hypothetical protein